MKVTKADENAVYQFVFSKRNDVFRFVTNFTLQIQFRENYDKAVLDDILDSLVACGKLKTNGVTDDALRLFWVDRAPGYYARFSNKWN